MLKHDTENTAPEILTDDQLELVSGGGGDYVGPAAKAQGSNAALCSGIGGAIMCAVNAVTAAT